MIKTSPPIEVCGRINLIDIIDECVQDVITEYIGKDLLPDSMPQKGDDKHSNKEVVACVSVLGSAPPTYPFRYQ